MKKKAYYKNQIRTISKTRARFLSIFCIVFLGAAFFAGLRHSPTIMKASMHHYLQTYQWNDLNYIGTLGFDQELIDQVEAVDGVEVVDYGFRFDGLMSFKNKSNIGVTVYTDDQFEKGVDIPELVSGKWPKNDTECLIDEKYFSDNEMKLNQEIEISNDYGTKTYKIVGTVNDSRYICDVERGTNSLGDGNNGAFLLILTKGNENMAVPEDLFELHDHKTIYNDLRIHLENPNDLYEFDDDYDDYVEPINEEIKKIFKSYYTSLYNEKKEDATKQIEDGQKEYDDGLKEYNDGVKAYQDGVNEYNNGLQQYNDGYAQYQNGLKEYNTGYAKYKDGLNQYNQGYTQYEDGLKQYEEGLKTYEQNLAQFNEGKNMIMAGLEEVGGYEQACQYKAYLEESGLAESEQYQEQYNQLCTLISGYDSLGENESALNEAKKSLDDNKAILDDTYQQLVSSKATLDATKAQLNSAKRQLDDTKVILNNSKVELDQAKTQLDDTLVTLNEAKAELDDAQIKLNDARAELDELVKGEAKALTKNESAAILSFAANCESINALSIMFPTIFFLVAALVSMTTMTRMVEELRTQNGTFRALGYKKRDVILQYLIYAFLATFFACGIGIVFGTYFFAHIIYYLYRIMMFDVGAPTRFVFEFSTCLQTFVISVAIILFVTFMVSYKELKDVPAQILRPKAPKIGKRILLERMTFIWRRLSFNQKVTMRNIFRYKKRFFMSVIGIAGCTALIVVGFGIKGSVSPLAGIQYGTMWTYDGIVNYPDDLDEQEAVQAREDFKNDKAIASSMGIYTKMITIDNQSVNIEVPSDKDEFDKYVHMEDYTTGKELKLSDDGVYINAKLSELLDVTTGDTIQFELEDKDYTVKVAGVYKLHFRHYMYMSYEYYQQLTNQKIDFHSEYFTLNDGATEDDVIDYCDQHDNISSVNFESGIAESFVSQIESLNSVVIILIVCAGALAFIVLYNLTNINIQERKSEIATIKVLGFYPKEVYDYVFRENIILAVIGSLFGLVLGKYVHSYIIMTVEIDMAMFIRNVQYTSYLYAIVLTMLFTFLINLFMRRVLRNIDMVESLKSIE